MRAIKGIEFWVINAAKVPIFVFKLGKHDVDEHLIGSFLSVFSAFAKEIEEGTLRMIVFDDVTYYFKEFHDGGLLFVLRTPLPHESFERLLNIAIELFLFHFPSELLARATMEIVNIPADLESTLQDNLTNAIVMTLEKLHGSWRDHLQMIPTTIICCRMDELMVLTEAMITGYPDETVYHYKQLMKDPLLRNRQILHVAGSMVGREVSRMMFPREITLTPKEVLSILDPLTICEYDDERKAFILKICPFCRGLPPSKSGDGQCHFVEGIIQGALANPFVKVKEIACTANKDHSCIFQLSRLE